ncbi:MAG: hypothetical protein WCP28_20010, partial [Actinomycetes bacterium]
GWTLLVADTFAGDVGSIYSWSLSITPEVLPPAPPPLVVQAQTPLAGCVTPPRSLPRTGTRQLTAPLCRTNGRMNITTTVTGKAKYKVVRKSNGMVSLKTNKTRGKITVTWSAPASAAFSAYRLTRSYRL